MAADRVFIDALRAAFVAHADAAQAGPMQAYMKSSLPFHGIAAPQRRQLAAAVVALQPLRDTETLADTMLALWREAGHREERYVASELANERQHRQLAGLRLLPVYEEMIRSGAWWDHCDEISGNGLPPLLQREPATIKATLRRWSTGGDLWLRRASMLSQRRLKAPAFDAVLLYETILPSIGSGRFADEFFIRKSIGWALRERSYQAPDEVQAFCREYAAQLSPLTKREALRVIESRRVQAGGTR